MISSHVPLVRFSGKEISMEGNADFTRQEDRTGQGKGIDSKVPKNSPI